MAIRSNSKCPHPTISMILMARRRSSCSVSNRSNRLYPIPPSKYAWTVPFFNGSIVNALDEVKIDYRISVAFERFA